MNKIIAGDDVGSRQILVKYGSQLPKTRYAACMLLAHRSGWLGWKTICGLIRWREKVKSYLIRFASIRNAGEESICVTPSASCKQHVPSVATIKRGNSMP